ncbi:4-(cytidine 5'-diphospho)-2-C-methyl-D-erythritol kinase [Meridianimarinicoccus aquatilis]|uniref:4-(cytidine 5'-diphospho)-2-C-methyl-D-erythritol kinase n=1 Tax=Meridianimarinicoccus aquatilis TaxID=2552766 RepID=UPI003742DE9E
MHLPLPKTAEAFAPAKINLCLHVTGRREDGYHLLDSLVVFADVGDRITATLADSMSLRVDGPMAGSVPVGPDNLVLRAATLFEPPIDAAITLTKNLPAAAGVGGGSSDAAACLRALSELSGRALPGPDRLLGLGADVPACVAAEPLRMQGIGEKITPWPSLPPLWVVLVNPRVLVSTPAVFKRLERRDNPPMQIPAEDAGIDTFVQWLAVQRNDMQSAACQIEPVITDVLTALSKTPGCALARMSGSGATCFGLFYDAKSAEQAQATIASKNGGWWCQSAAILK